MTHIEKDVANLDLVKNDFKIFKIFYIIYDIYTRYILYNTRYYIMHDIKLANL